MVPGAASPGLNTGNSPDRIGEENVNRKKESLTNEKIKREVKEFILLNFLPGEKAETLQEDDLLFEGGIIDSVGAMTLIGFLGKEYEITILDEELFPENFKSINKIAEFISHKMNAAAKPCKSK
jgi:acyl carrier protein